jgi:hypothetical protein
MRLTFEEHMFENNKYELWQKMKVPDDLLFKGITQAYWKSLYSNHWQLCQEKCEKWDLYIAIRLN